MKNTITFSLLTAALVLVGASCTTTEEATTNTAVEETGSTVAEVTVETDLVEETTEESEAMAEQMADTTAMATDEMESTFASDNSDGLMTEEVEVEYTRMADLVDVSGGSATGTAKLGTNGEGEHILMVDFDNLPELEEGFFYEGWLVDKDPFSFITTGATEVVDGQVVNLYSSNASLDQYDRYVLTLEPDDGDPAPAEHIVEEDFVAI